jgi:hypothetical protein
MIKQASTCYRIWRNLEKETIAMVVVEHFYGSQLLLRLWVGLQSPPPLKFYLTAVSRSNS